MPHRIDLEQLCADKGLRITEQRRVIARVLSDADDHPDVEMVHERANKIDPGISIATVYRTVRLLRSLHLVNEVIQGGVGHYEIADPQARHHHMVCEHCGTAIHVPTRYLDELRRRLTRDTGFEPHMEHFTISGLCAECRADVGHSHTGHTHAGGHAHGEGDDHVHDNARPRGGERSWK